MKKIEEIDKNFASYVVQYEGMKVFDINREPFRIYGLRQSQVGMYERMPQQIADSINGSVSELNRHTSGGRIRFQTDSQQIIISEVLSVVTRFSHMPLTGTSCFDLYADGHYVDGFRPDFTQARGDEHNRYDATLYFSERKVRDILIHFPLYNEVRDVFIAVEEDAVVLPGKEYQHTKPVVFYGSSITQGGCASHPGNCYPAIISRRLDCDYINLGFSSGCFGEDAMADYLSNLEMGILVYDYDHNAADADVLEKTHERFFKRIRNNCPELPIIIVSAADNIYGSQEKRREVIRRTYENAIKAGDKNVYMINGQDIYRNVGVDYCTVDAIHANDLGFWCMAQSIGAVIEKI